MARKKLDDDDKQKFKSVGLLTEDHALLRQLAEAEQRSMARQISVLIRDALAAKCIDRLQGYSKDANL
tara:strand:- start:404 stop:607 length:204 start_codon:yes stop_codon:yes gene_type:complete